MQLLAISMHTASSGWERFDLEKYQLDAKKHHRSSGRAWEGALGQSLRRKPRHAAATATCSSRRLRLLPLKFEKIELNICCYVHCLTLPQRNGHFFCQLYWQLVSRAASSAARSAATTAIASSASFEPCCEPHPAVHSRCSRRATSCTESSSAAWKSVLPYQPRRSYAFPRSVPSFFVRISPSFHCP